MIIDSTQIRRRVPVPVLLPQLDLCRPTGVILAGSRVVVVADRGKIATRLLKELKSAGAEGVLVAAADLEGRLSELAKEGNLAGAYFLPGLDADPHMESGSMDEWQVLLSERAAALYQIGRALPEGAFLVGATRMGGLHGLVGGENPLGGLVTGFMKALRRERPQQFVKIVDFAAKASAGSIAEALIAETLHDPATVEVGRESGLRYGVTLQEVPTLDADTKTLQAGSVFVVSGATGGITGAVVRDLARATQGTFYLLGRANLPVPGDPDLLKLVQDRQAFRLELQERLQNSSEKVTPVQIEQHLQVLERASATLELMDAVKAAGGQTQYIQCDVTDAAAVTSAVETIRQSTQRVDVFIHAAGLEKSRKLETKPLDEFQQVIAVKALGFKNLFTALECASLMPRQVVFFSSVAGRFGNAGQTDYSAANDLLSKLAFWLPQRYPGLQAVSLDWSAWAEVGMSSRGKIPRLMELAGVDMLKPEFAAPLVRRELVNGQNGEVVLAGSLGRLESPQNEESSLNVEAADLALRAGTPIHSMFSHITGFSACTGVRFEAELNPQELFYLRDHALNGIPLLPGAMGIAGFLMAAKLIASVLAATEPGLEVKRLESIQFHAPIKFYGLKPRTIIWHAVAYRLSDEIMVKVALESDMHRHNGMTEHLLNFDGLVYLDPNHQVKKKSVAASIWSKQDSVSAEEIYRLYFHGPSFQVLEAAQFADNTVLGRFNMGLVDVSANDPDRFVTPLLIELCFQTAGLWEAGATGILALPQSVGSLKLYPQPLNGEAIFAEVNPCEREGTLSFDARVVDANGNVFLELEDYRTAPLPYTAQKDLIDPLKILVGPRTENNCR